MTNHVHLIFHFHKGQRPELILDDLMEFTAKK